MHFKTLRVMSLFFLLLPYNSAISTTKDNNAYRVVVAPTVLSSVPLQLEYIGNMEANNSAAIKARVTGDVMSYKFKEGSFVKKGELLFVIDPRPYKATLLAKRAKYLKDKARLAYALNQVKRYKPLSREDFISKDDYFHYQTEAETLQAQVKLDQADIRLAELNVNYCYVKAPFSGRTGPRLTDPGNLVESKGGRADPTLVVLKQLNPIKVTFAVPEKDLSVIREAHRQKALKLSLVPNGAPNHTYEGRLWLFDNKVDIKTGMILMEGILPNGDEQLWPGKFATVTLSLKTNKDTLLIPTKAILLGQSGPYVYTVDERNKTQLRALKTGRLFKDKTIVISGLKAGERVVVEGQEGLQSNMTVKIGNA